MTILRPYIWHELPRWGWLYSQCVGDYTRDAEWKGLQRRIVRGKLHGYEMELDLGAWSERMTFFLGRFYDLGMQLLLQAVLRPGDRFVDVGANIGMLSLLASRLVGVSGRVDAVEPNSCCVERINWAIARNGISNIVIHECATGERSGTATLSIPSWNSGEATLTPLASGEEGRTVRPMTVSVRRADDIVAEVPRAPVLIKIDVEGYEFSVLRGLTKAIRDHRPLIVTEVLAENLERAGSRAADLYDLMRLAGYAAFGISTRRAFVTHRLHLEPCAADRSPPNVLWVASGSSAGERVAGLCAGGTGSVLLQ